ncbi:MAG: gliding motility-associated C-terminal domain-containing protein [Bacteroidales bacterium]|nr:gliding motility-associated C-terminal domain-containing protein [Bacteroidales bacterium]
MCLGGGAGAQQIVRVDVDTVACLHDTVRIAVGHTAAADVEVRDMLLNLSHAERAFLPDGVSCPPYGCSYRSHVTFSGLDNSVQIRTVEDIKFVRLNIEHSFIGDLYIGVVCPNGQRASLMNWSGSGSSSCDDEVPAGSRSWAAGSNVYGSTYLGAAYDYTDYSNKCDSTSSNNSPGTGWNYCWSSSNTHGYQYASGDGRIYRSANRSGYSIDSSIVAQGRRFYRPDQSFQNLVGCPVNGTWYIEVIDAYSGDNGWVFDWELSLDETLVPMAGVMTGCTVLGDEVTRQNDTVWNVTSPSGTTGDTTVEYTVRIYGTGMPSVRDTVVRVHYYPQLTTEQSDTLCWGETATLAGVGTLTRDTTVVRRLLSAHGCDSVVTNRYFFREKIEDIDTDYVCYGGSLTVGSVVVTRDTVLSDTLTAACGCDSVVSRAVFFRPPFTGLDSVLACVGDTLWVGAVRVTADTTVADTLTAGCGCDSVVARVFTYHPVYTTLDTVAFCAVDGYRYDTVAFDAPGDYVLPRTSAWGCDSTVKVRINVIDSAFLPRMLLSADGERWSADTVLLGCEPYGIHLKDTTPLTVWRQWIITPADTIGGDTLVSHRFDSAGVYGVTLLSVSAGGCRDTLHMDSVVWVFGNPEAHFSWLPLEPPLHDPQVDFVNESWPQGEDMGWLWAIGGTQGTDTSSDFSPSYRWDTDGQNPSGEHVVTLTALWTRQGPDTLTTVCRDTVEHTVTVVNDWLQFPTLVTPNGDGINDRWEVVNLVDMGQYPMNEIWIYNQWGARVFHAVNVYRHEDFWDPNATNSPDGTYYYRFLGRSAWGVVKQNGTIEVMRN